MQEKILIQIICLNTGKNTQPNKSGQRCCNINITSLVVKFPLNICIGGAERTIEGDLVSTLESIIYAPYSHTTVDNVKSFRKSKDYFEYLTKNHIEARYLRKHKFLLEDIFNQEGGTQDEL